MLLEHLGNASHAWNENLSVAHDSLDIGKVLFLIELADHYCSSYSFMWQLDFRQVVFVLVVLVEVTFTVRSICLELSRLGWSHVSLRSSLPLPVVLLFDLEQPVLVYLPVFFQILDLHNHPLLHVVSVGYGGGRSGGVLDDTRNMRRLF